MADVYPCIALEDIAQSTDVMVSQNAGMVCSERSGGRLMMRAFISVENLVGDSRLHDLGQRFKFQGLGSVSLLEEQTH